MTLLKVNDVAVADSSSQSTDDQTFTFQKNQYCRVDPDDSITKSQELPVDAQKRIFIRLCVFICSLTLLVAGRYNVPDNAPDCVVDKAMDWFQGVNDFILANPFWRNTMQIICSLFMDIMFLATCFYWVFKGRSSRLVVSVITFYVIRAIVQAIWFSPYTKGFWWYDPGFPSLVVPYGRGSDFFFSGHIGFVTICACEWHAYGKMLAVKILAIGGVYTGFILLAYQVHYSIDLFTGVFFAHYVWIMVDKYKESLDEMFTNIYIKGSESLKSMTGSEK